MLLEAPLEYGEWLCYYYGPRMPVNLLATVIIKQVFNFKLKYYMFNVWYLPLRPKNYQFRPS
jgi:hypothetical protein